MELGDQVLIGSSGQDVIQPIHIEANELLSLEIEQYRLLPRSAQEDQQRHPLSMSQDVSKLTMIKENFNDTFMKTTQQKQEQLIHSFQQQPYHGTEFYESMSQQRKSAEEKSHSDKC